MTDMADDLDRIRRQCERQHGLVHLHDLADLPGARRRAVRRALGLVAVNDSVLRLQGAPRTPMQAAMAAVLGAGPEPLLSHISSNALWRIPGFLLEPHHVMARRPGSRVRSSTSWILHRPRLVLPHHHTVVDGIPVTTPARTLFDLAGMGLHPLRIERALDTAWSRRLVTHASLHRVLIDLAERGRTGITLMRSLLEARGPSYIPPASGLELRFQDLMRKAGVLELERQLDTGSGNAWIGRTDFALKRLALLIQVDGATFHTSLLDREHDQAQDDELIDAGWTVMRFTEAHVWYRHDEVVDAVLLTIRELRAGLPPTSPFLVRRR